MKRTLYAILALLALAACQQQNELLEQEECVLELNLSCAHMPVVTTRAIDVDLAVTILDAEGKVYKRIPAGKVPDVIPMRAGTFTLCAHTDNLDTWKEANNGRGEACYYASEEVTIQFGEKGYLSMSVPMTNYAVGLELPEEFDNLFASHQLSIVSGDRDVEIQEGENAYFDVADGGFTYALSVTNTDGDSHTQEGVLFSEVEKGKLYLISYDYGLRAVNHEQ